MEQENKLKLDKYQKNLRKVEDLLSLNPSDNELHRLKADLLQVISLTETLIAQESIKSQQISSNQANKHISHNATHTTLSKKDSHNPLEYNYTPLNSNDHTQKESIALSDSFSHQQQQQQQQLFDEEKTLNFTNKKRKKGNQDKLYVGGRCEVEISGTGKYSPCVIDNISSEPDTKQVFYNVRHIVNNKAEKVYENSGRIRDIKPKKGSVLLDMEKLKLGTCVLAKYSVDGEWYKAKIIEIAKEGAVVQYTEYGNREKLPFEYLVIDSSVPQLSNSSLGATESLNPYLQNEVDGDQTGVPDNLKILPTDSEKVKEKKRKRLKALKKKSRDALAEHLSEQRQRGWQSFQTKKQGQKGIQSDSIFRVPDLQVDGDSYLAGKVGVTNSGKGMTKFDDTRIRYGYK